MLQLNHVIKIIFGTTISCLVLISHSSHGEAQTVQRWARFCPRDSLAIAVLADPRTFAEFLEEYSESWAKSEEVTSADEEFLNALQTTQLTKSLDELITNLAKLENITLVLKDEAAAIDVALVISGQKNDIDAFFKSLTLYFGEIRKLERSIEFLQWLIGETLPDLNFAPGKPDLNFAPGKAEFRGVYIAEDNFVIATNSNLVDEIKGLIDKTALSPKSLASDRKFQRVLSNVNSNDLLAFSYINIDELARNGFGEYSEPELKEKGIKEFVGVGIGVLLQNNDVSGTPFFQVKVVVPHTLPENLIIELQKTYKPVFKWPDFDLLADEKSKYELAYLRATNRLWIEYMNKARQFYSNKSDAADSKWFNLLLEKVGAETSREKSFAGHVINIRGSDKENGSFLPVWIAEHVSKEDGIRYVERAVDLSNEGTLLTMEPTQLESFPGWFLTEENAKRQFELDSGRQVDEGEEIPNLGLIVTEDSIWFIDKNLFLNCFLAKNELSENESIETLFPGYLENIAPTKPVEIELFLQPEVRGSFNRMRMRYLQQTVSRKLAFDVAFGVISTEQANIKDEWYPVLNKGLSSLVRFVDRSAIAYSVGDGSIRWNIWVFR